MCVMRQDSDTIDYQHYTLLVPSKIFVCPLSLNFQLIPWLTSLGYSLCYGVILVKMARVWYIFNNPTIQKKMV